LILNVPALDLPPRDDIVDVIDLIIIPYPISLILHSLRPRPSCNDLVCLRGLFIVAVGWRVLTDIFRLLSTISEVELL
jgi:hypothetical protein